MSLSPKSSIWPLGLTHLCRSHPCGSIRRVRRRTDWPWRGELFNSYFCLLTSLAFFLHPFFLLLIGEISAKIPRVSTVQEISQAIEHLDVRDQMRLLHDLPAHLKIQPDDVAWLKAAESAFEFWNNPEDAIYDKL